MLSVNFVGNDHNANARRKTIVLAGFFALVVALASAAGAAASYRSVNRGTNVLTEFGDLPVISDVRRIVFGEDAGGLSTKKDDRYLNILLLGIGGAGHDGPLLTDTIILASIDTKEKRVGMVSIPRDLAYPLGGGRFEKINAVHAYEEQDHPGEGAIRTAEKFSSFLGVPIDHVVRIDFRGFASLVDALGGIEVNVERSFTDAEYPAANDLYTVVSFKKGLQTMDGRTALQYARSRHGSNGEGSDFARSRRQQIVMVAVRDKLVSLNTLSDPSKLAKLYTALTSHIQTDLTPWDAIRYAPLAEAVSPENITQHVLNDGPEGQLVPGHNQAGAYLLFPKNNDWGPVKTLAQNPFLTKEEFNAANAPLPPVAKLEIKNGTFRTGFAASIADRLALERFSTLSTSNATRRQYQRTVIFDLTGGKKPAELAKLKKILDADVSLSTVETDKNGVRTVYGDNMSLERVTSPEVDFLVILGETSVSFATDADYADQTQ